MATATIAKGKQVRVEIKLARNGKFWSGIRKQLPHYLKANSTTKGFFLVVADREADF